MMTSQAVTATRCWRIAVIVLVICATGSLGWNLTILHTNDVHSRVEQMNKYGGACSDSNAAEGKCYGGVARRKTKIDEIRGTTTNVLLLDGGDQYQGTMWFYQFKGIVMSKFMNLLGYDAMCLGNHEFDLGIEGLLPFLANVTFPVLSCNLDMSNTPKLSPLVVKHTTFNMKGQQVGVIGYTTTETVYISKPGKVKFNPEIASVQAAVKELKAKNVNKIIALGHAGYEVDQKIAAIPGVDIVVGGHTNTFLYSGTAPSNDDPQGDYPTVVENGGGGKALVVQDYAYGKYLGQLNVVFDDAGTVTSWSGNPILLDKSVKQDQVIMDNIKPLADEIKSLKYEVLGQTHVHLNGDRQTCRVRECNMGNLITDAMVRQNIRHSDATVWSDVTIALINGGGIRSSVMKGNITTQDILSVMPFRNTVDIVKLSGKTLHAALEYSVSKRKTTGELFGGFLQMSGLRVVYDMRKPINSRVVQVHALCSKCDVPKYEKLNTTEVYSVLLSTFVIEGGDGYVVIRDNIIERHALGDVDAQILLDYITEYSPIIHGLDNRIRLLGDGDDDDYDAVCAGYVSTASTVQTLCSSRLMLCLQIWIIGLALTKTF